MNDIHRQILNNAADLVERGWTRDTGARNAKNKTVPYHSPEAIGWCMIGAIYRAAHDLGIIEEVVSITHVLRKHVGVLKLTEWNDAKGRTKEEVIQALRETAEST